MKPQKPTKKPYPDQEATRNAVIEQLKNIVSKPCVQEAYVWGSLANNTFGTYNKPHQDRNASDIDLIIVINEEQPLPETWKSRNTEKTWFSLYKLGTIQHEGNTHPIDGLLIFPSRHDVTRMKQRIQDNNIKLR